MPTTNHEAAQSVALPRGTGVGRYVVLERLGQGGMGTVYAAFDPDLDRRVALKLLALGDGHSARELGQEARVLAKLAHPNVATVFDVGLADAGLYIAMELVDGGDLSRWLEREPRSASQILAVFVDAGRGLAAAHDKGLVHRDFKPSNVLIGSDGRVRVADFGLARLITDEDPSRRPDDTMRGMALASGTVTAGTPGFIAPEVLEGDPPDVDADQFSFCVSLVLSLTGSMPDELPDVEAALAATSPPREVRRAILRGLSPRPDERFESMHDLLEVLAARPRSRLRPALAIGLGLSLLGGGLAWSRARADEPIDPCAAGPEALASAWNDGRADALRRALTDVDAPYAAQTAERVHGRLSGWSEAWTEAHERLCGRPGEPDAEGRRRCLDDRLIELSAMLSALEQPDGAALDQASQAVAGLRSPAFCTDPDWTPPPANLEPPPSIATEVAALRPAVELALAFEGTGQFERALAELDEAAPKAEALGHAPLLAELLYVRGLVLMQQGHYDDAEPVLGRAFTAALTAGHDEVMVQAASLLVSAMSSRQADIDRAILWNELAGAAATRIGPDSEQAATHWQAVGVLAFRQEDFDRSREAVEHALTLYRRHLPPDHPAIPTALSLRAALESAQRRYVEAEATAREVLALRAEILGEDHPALMTDEVTLASALTPQGKPDEAIEHLERALVLGASLDPDHPRRLGVQNNLASALNRKGEHERARDLYAEILRVRLRDQGREDPATALAHNNLATSLYRMGELEEALSHEAEAVAIYETVLGPTHDQVALVLNSHAVTLEVLERCDEARTAIDRAWGIVAAPEADPGQPHPLTAFIANTRAVVLSCQDDEAGAIAMARRAVEVAESSPGEPRASLSRFLVTLARAGLKGGELDTAEGAARRALEELEPGPSLSRARTDFILAQVARARGDATEGRRRAEQARAHLPKLGARSEALAGEIDRWLASSGPAPAAPSG